MRCDEVREVLAEHLLGTLPEPEDLEVRGHLRGCAGCRREMAALAEGVSLFSRAAHETAPPEGLKERVLSVLEEEWAQQPAPAGAARKWNWMAAAAAIVVLAGSLGWAAAADRRAVRYEADAANYQNFLGVLGGENVRVGTLSPRGSRDLHGSVVLYDAKAGEQSWALLLVRAPGMEGTADVTLSSSDGRTIRLHELTFEAGGDASTWLVTSSSLKPYDRVAVTAPDGTQIATGTISGERTPTG